MQTHLFSYRHDGKHWELGIKAASADDARRRVAALAHASYDGVLVAKIPASLSPIGIATVWVQNAAINLFSRFAKSG